MARREAAYYQRLVGDADFFDSELPAFADHHSMGRALCGADFFYGVEFAGVIGRFYHFVETSAGLDGMSGACCAPLQPPALLPPRHA